MDSFAAQQHQQQLLINIATMAQGCFLFVLIFTLSVFYLDAFLPDSRPTTSRSRRRVLKHSSEQSSNSNNRNPLQHSSSIKASNRQIDDKNDNDETASSLSQQQQQSSPSLPFLPDPLTHSDIVWKLRPPPEQLSFLQRLWLRFAANLIRLDCKIFRKDEPVVLCPKGGQAVLEAYCYTTTGGGGDDDQSRSRGRLQKVGRFGFTTERGPPAPPIQDTVQDLYGISTLVGVGAIIYMFVESPYRKQNIGSLALEVISMIHAIQGMDFTVLVVDDDGSGKLIEWYQQNGYVKAPRLQDILGSPNAENGITMIAPTNAILPQDCRIQWW